MSPAPRSRPKRTQATIEKVSTGCGNLYVAVGSDDIGVAEVFATLGKAGGCAACQLEGLSRMVSLALRSGVDIPTIAHQLKGIRCSQIAWDDGSPTLSCADAISKALERAQEGPGGAASPVPVSSPPTMPEAPAKAMTDHCDPFCKHYRVHGWSENSGGQEAGGSEPACWHPEHTRALTSHPSWEPVEACADWEPKVAPSELPTKEIRSVHLTKNKKPARTQRAKDLGICPECGGMLMFEEGCLKCRCGYSQCG